MRDIILLCLVSIVIENLAVSLTATLSNTTWLFGFTFKFFFLSWMFYFTIMWLGVDLFILLEICWTSQFVVWCPSLILKKISAIISLNTAVSLFSLLLEFRHILDLLTLSFMFPIIFLFSYFCLSEMLLVQFSPHFNSLIISSILFTLLLNPSFELQFLLFYFFHF